MRAEMDSRAFFPNELGHFHLQDSDLMFGSVLTVEGPNFPLGQMQHAAISSTAQSSGMGASASYNSNLPPPPPAFKSVIPKPSCSKEQVASVKVVRAVMNTSRSGKTEFTPEAQMHLDISESTANVEHVTMEVKQRWGEQYIVVTADGLELEDCEGTQGMLCICMRLLKKKALYMLLCSFVTFRAKVLEVPKMQDICSN